MGPIEKFMLMYDTRAYFTWTVVLRCTLEHFHGLFVFIVAM